MDLPELSKPIVSNLAIDLIVDFSVEEWNGAGIHDEENNSSGEYVHLQSIVNSSLYLRSPIAVSANPYSIHLPSNLLRMPEVRELEGEIEVKEYILRLQIAMRDACLMEVLDSGKELSYVVPRELAGKPACFGQIQEKLISLLEFQHYHRADLFIVIPDLKPSSWSVIHHGY